MSDSSNTASDLPPFEELVGRHYSLAYHRACHLLDDPHLAHDAVQEAFAAAFQKIGQLREPDAFAAWLLRLVGTQCSRLRRRQQPDTVPLADLEDRPSPDANPEQLAIDADIRRQISARISDLPHHEREATRLYYLEGYSQKEVADAIGVPENTVKSRLYSSRRRLQSDLGTMMCAGSVFAPGAFLVRMGQDRRRPRHRKRRWRVGRIQVHGSGLVR